MGLTRRIFVFATSAVALAPRIAAAQASSTTTPAGPFRVPALPYPANALEPHIDALTMEIHHDRHHGAYVANLNAIAKDYPKIAEAPVAEVLATLNQLPEQIRAGVRNNLGGHVYHSMFWQIMSPTGGKPSTELTAAIDRDLGGLDKLQNDFNANGLRVFGSGWTIVTVTREGKLALETRPNQDSVLMDGKRALFGNDVWEHAYYLHYQNRRAEYLKAWWNVLNWNALNERYAAAKAGSLEI
ncbi:MAG TPA: superoxide dismutase [Bradyrhizobium sp.]|nr:superoxide dismutase [Bradyrhizobium sp.]